MLYRIGAVSKLSGVPVPTLRVWESRHAAFAPAKSGGQHRLYSEADVIRARLLRQLTEGGHSIGGIARLAAAQLQQLLAGVRVPAGEARAAAPRKAATIVVGEAVAARIHAPAWKEVDDAMDVRHVFVDLEEAAAAPADERPAELLLARLNTVQPTTQARLERAMARHGVRRAIVLYNFGAAPVVEALQASGMIVRREPIAAGELAQLVGAVVMVDAAQAMSDFEGGALIPARRYSDATLARVAAAPNDVVCECPKHIAELIGQLAAFEEYSEQCLNDSSEDAALHAYLRSIAGSTRALFEHALQRAAAHGGLALEEDAKAAGSSPARG